jgi:D-psicose/D-tagatose/L-ribulose 3-epimerase
MKLSVSNIAWDPEEEEQVLDLLSRLDVDGIEVAPTKLWPDWVGANPAAARNARTALGKRGFEIPALQAILFGRPDLLVFGSPDVRQQLVDHIDRVAALAAGLGADVLVFGSPKNRDRGERSEADARSEAQAVFHDMGEACVRHCVRLCIEPNPKTYACTFMTNWRDARAMVEAAGSAGVGLHHDVACISLEGDDVVEAVETCAGGIAHFHVTEPELGDFSSPTLDHAAIGEALRRTGYDGWLSIEMRRSDDPLRSVEEAVTRVLEWYA